MTDFEADAFYALVAVADDESDHGASAWQVAQVMGGGTAPCVVGGALARMVRRGLLQVVGLTPGLSRRYGLTAAGRVLSRPAADVAEGGAG